MFEYSEPGAVTEDTPYGLRSGTQVKISNGREPPKPGFCVFLLLGS